MPQRPDRVQRQWRIPAVLPVLGTLVVCAGLLVFVASRADDESAEAPTTTAPTTTAVPTTSTTTTTTTAPPEPLDLAALTVAPLPEDVVAAYRIRYDVVENGLPRQETWTVRRPYESLIVAERDDVIVSGTATSRGQLSTYLTDRNGWFAIQPELHRAAFDQRPLTVMATMVAAGLAEPAGSDRHADRECSKFVTGSPLGSGSVSPPGDERTEVCIDDRGLVLHERWEIDGSVLSERTAADVEIDPVLDPTVFDPEPRIEDAPELDVLLSNIAVPADDETIAGLRVDIVVPPGFRLDGTVFRASTSETGAGGASETVRFYSDGRELIELVEVDVAGPAELDGGGARPVEIDGFEETWFAPDFRVSVLRARMSDSSFVELRGADPRQLVELLRSITVR